VLEADDYGMQQQQPLQDQDQEQLWRTSLKIRLCRRTTLAGNAAHVQKFVLWDRQSVAGRFTLESFAADRGVTCASNTVMEKLWN